jgi:hypothetical protein
MVKLKFLMNKIFSQFITLTKHIFQSIMKPKSNANYSAPWVKLFLILENYA